MKWLTALHYMFCMMHFEFQGHAIWRGNAFFFFFLHFDHETLILYHWIHDILTVSDFYSDTIPFDGVPSYKGHTVKYSYKITVGTSRVQGHSKLLKLPVRILSLQGECVMNIGNPL